MQKNKEYIELTEEFAQEIYNYADDETEKLVKEQKINEENILSKIAKILLTYKIVDSIMQLTLGDKQKLYTQMEGAINNNFNKEGKSEANFTKALLIKVGLDKYYSNSYIMSLGIDFKLKKVSSKDLEDIINKTIEGKLYSDRIWTNKNNVAKLLKVKIKEFLEGKISVNDIEKEIKAIYKTNRYNTNRLVSNEIARVQEGCNELWREENDIEWVLYSATLDSKTCNDCGMYDGKVYKVDSKPVELPKHVKCRCTYISLPDKNWKPSKRRDNKTKETIDFTTYEEWKKENNI